jgi:hypothetical protein
MIALSVFALRPAFADAVTDYSSTSSVGVWSYGWVVAGSSDTTGFEAFNTNNTDDPVVGVNSWSQGALVAPPFIARNTTSGDVAYGVPYAGILQPVDLLLLYSGTGDWAVLRWTAPADAVYDVNGYLQNIDTTDGSTADVSFAVDGALVSLGSLDYGINAYVIGQQFFAEGQTLDFVVQSGGAGVSLSADSVPEPASLLLAGIGLLGLGVWRRRR